MLFEILTTASMLGVLGASSYYKSSNNDVDKIVKIANNSGLSKKDESIRIYRRHYNKKKKYTEYVFKIPYGLEAKDFQDKIGKFKDGLNNRSQHRIDLKQIKDIDLNKNVLKQIQSILNHRESLNREVELKYDGMLKVRVYDQGLKTEYNYNDEILKGLRGWEVPIGYTLNGLIKHDFEKRNNMIVAGTTGFGKSELVKLLISVLVKRKPDDVRYHLIDLKGGTELGLFKDMKQTKNFARTLTKAKEVLEEAQQDMGSKLDWLFEKGLNHVKLAGQTERDFLIIDEAGELDEDCKDIVVDIARRGRSAGYKVIYTTQYPTNETLPSQVRANIGVKICFRLETKIQSMAVLDEGGAERLPEIEGRAIFRRVKNYTIQAILIKPEDIQRIIKPHQRRGRRASHEIQTTETPRSHLAKFEET